MVAVEGTQLARVDSFSLRTASGETLTFTVEALALTDGGKPAPHLREHMTSGEPIVVEYRTLDGGNLALRYYDAP